MATTRYALEGSASAAPPCTPSDVNKLALDTQVQPGTFSLLIAPEAVDEESLSWCTDTGVPGIGDWALGNYVGRVNVSSLGADVSYTVSLFRVNSSCTIQDSIGTSASQSATGNFTHTVSAFDPSSGATGDLFQMRIRGSNTHMHNEEGLAFTVPTATTYMEGDFVADLGVFVRPVMDLYPRADLRMISYS